MRLKEVITTMSDDLTRNLPPSQDGTLAQILTIVQNLSTRLESLDQRFGGLEQRFVSHEQKVEDRLYDTRPIWEKVQTDIARLQEGQESLREGQDSLRKDVRELNTHWRDMNRKLSIFNDTLAEIQADYRDIYDRVRGLERQSS
jgi:chromosome segregation ATPase